MHSSLASGAGGLRSLFSQQRLIDLQETMHADPP